MWEPGRGLESVQEDVIMQCSHVGYHYIGTCEMWARTEELCCQMQWEGVQPDSVTFVGVLNACASVFALEEGRRVHEQIIESGQGSDVFVGSTLVDMYAKCGSMDDACGVFNKLPAPNVVTWNAILAGCA
jgi:pentatricopeptide repeat protein